MRINHFINTVLVAIGLIAASTVQGQITVQFIPSVGGKNLQSLSMTQLTNGSASAAQVNLSIMVKHGGSEHVLTIKTPMFVLNPGINVIDRSAFSNAHFSFAQNYFGNIIRQTGSFPEGDYEYCFLLEIFKSGDPRILPSYEQCFEHSVQPLTPLLLILPAEADELCNKRPGFSWQPSLPLQPGTRFRLTVTEIKDRQDPLTAIAFNIPLINQAEIPVHHITYPVNIPELKEGARYAWQVSVYANNALIKKSEIWQFAVRCKEESKPDESDSYREVKEVLDGHLYYAYTKLRFFFSNPYNHGPLDYRIYSLSGKQEEVKRLPRLNSVNGYNQFEIDLSEINSFKDGKEYLMQIRMVDGRMLQLRFVYKEM